MAVPKKRHSTHRKGKRRAAIKLKLPPLSKCPKCKQAIRPHTVCFNCGYYKDRDILKLDLKSVYEKKRRSKAPEKDKSR